MIYILSLGGNTADASANILHAIEELGRSVIRRSSMYTTAATGGKSPDYTNMVAAIASDLDLEAMNQQLKQMERAAGRTPADKSTGLVPLDIDIVMADGRVVRERDFSQSYFTIGYAEIQ